MNERDCKLLWDAVEQSPYDLDRWGVLADALADLDETEAEADIRESLALNVAPIVLIKRGIIAESERLHKAVEATKFRLRKLQEKCQHKSTRYQEDPSGNNDWYDECLDCGKAGKRL